MENFYFEKCVFGEFMMMSYDGNFFFDELCVIKLVYRVEEDW